MQVRVKVDSKDSVTYLKRIATSLNKGVVDGVTEASKRLTYYVREKYLSRKGNNSIGRDSSDIYTSTVAINTQRKGNVITGGTHIGSSPKAKKYTHVHVSSRPKTTVIYPKKSNGRLAIPILSTTGGKRMKARDIRNPEFRGEVLGSNTNGLFTPYFVMKRYVVIRSRVHTKKIASEYTSEITKIIDRNIEKSIKT